MINVYRAYSVITKKARFVINRLIVLLVKCKMIHTSRNDFDVVCQTNNGALSRADVVDRVRRVVSLRGIQITHSSGVTDIDGTDTRVRQSDEGSARII